jgi:fructokinase
MSNTKHYPVVCFGETLWDMLPTGKQAGGAPMNVAYHLQKLGKTPAVISKIGYDELGKQLIETLEAKNICTEYFQMDEHKPTSVVQAEIRDGHEVVYTIVKDVAWDYIEYNDELATLVSNADYFVFGSLAIRSSQTRDTLLKLLPLAKNKVLDINLRPPFYNRSTIELLLTQANIIKLNQAELELITGWFSPLINEIERIQLLKDRFELDMVIVTRGAKGAIVNKGDAFYTCNGIPVTVADTVGSGDSFLAAIIAKMMEGATMNEALQFANNLAAFVTTQKGSCPDYNVDELADINTSTACTINVHQR